MPMLKVATEAHKAVDIHYEDHGNGFSPRDGDVVPAGEPVRIAARFGDHGGSRIDPDSVQITVSGRNITREVQVDRESFNFLAALPPGRHTVDVTMRDMAGNMVRQGWSFDVAR